MKEAPCRVIVTQGCPVGVSGRGCEAEACRMLR